ncbi:MAG: putative Ig domain-containing protein [Gammaproteobacteria bacterium]|nr:putative Ig domain-containing protein [Gammaproteobacteria bacterium]
MVDAEASVDENDDGATIAAVTTENSTEVTVDNDYFEVADGNLKLKDGMSLDFENVEGGMIEVTLTAVSDGDDATATVSITVNDVNEDPSIDVRDGEEVPGHPGVISSLTIAENATRDDAPPLALIEVMDPDAADADMLTGDAGVAATSVSDDRFAVILDPEDGLWLHLAAGASLDHEAGSEITVTVTYTDSAGNTASQDVTVMVTDVNEAPVAVGEVGNVAAEAGKALSHEVDLMSLFSDPEGSDTIDSWTLSGGPDWLELVTRHGDDGSMTGILQGTPPTTGAESAAEHMVTITATDNGGETATVSFYVVVDDGNDRPTGINLIDDGQSVIEVEVTEGDASGVVLGEIVVDDIDSPHHPYGQHLITVDDDRFEIRHEDGRKWLALKEGESLDRERESGEVLVTLRAIDRNGERDEDGDYEGFRSDPVTFAVVINDVNDAPRGGTIGNWWATIDDSLDAGDIDDGDWVSFELENQDDGDRFPAFTDQDLRAGDSLTYSISGPSWLQIDEETGHITNVKDVKPVRGVYRVTVTATDEDGQSASKSFNLNVAWSDAADDGTLTKDNEGPDLNVLTSRPEYREGSGERRVLTFRVEDEDQNIPDHQFALKTVRIKAITNPDGIPDPANPTGPRITDPNNVTLVDHDGDDSGTGGDTTANDGLNSDGQRATPMRLWTNDDGDATTGGPGYAAALQLSDPTPSSIGWTFHLEAVDTNPSPYIDTTRLLNYESVDEIEVTLEISDGVTTLEDDDAQFDFGIADTDEAPRAPAASSTDTTALVQSTDLRVEQDATNVKLLYIKLGDLWTDDSDSDNQLEFDAETSGSWVDIWRGPADWSDIAPGRDGNAAETDDNIPWPTSDGTTVAIGPAGDQTTYDTVIIGTNNDEPGTGTEPDQMVVIVAIDRTERNNQGDRGSFTLSATDDRGRGETGERTYNVSIIDENVAIEEGAVTLSGSVREGSRLTANFNDNRDPDLAGSAEPALVLYTWYRVTDDGSDADDLSDDTVVVRAHGTSNTYTPVQGDVGHEIRVVVNYYDVPITSSTNDGSQDAESVSLRGQLVGTAFTATPTVTADSPAINVATTSRAVSNTPDRGTADITILANSDTLTVANTDLRIVDGDYPFVPASGGTVVPDPTDLVDNEDPTDTTPDGIPDDAIISFEVSTNGRGGWTAVDDDDVTFDAATGVTTLSLDDGEGMYYRAVATYDADTGDNAARERVVSDPIQVSDVRDATGAPPLATAIINGSPNPGGTLSVEVPNTTFSVQWQIQESGNWVDIPGATGDLRLTQAHAGENIRAVVSYMSRDPDNPGVTAVTTVDVTNADTTGNVIGGTPSDQRPVRESDYEIEGSVGGTGHGFLAVSRANHNATIEDTVPLTSLFQDPDTPSFLLRFTATNLERPGDPDVELVATPTPTGTTYVYQQTDANGGGVLVFDARSGKLTYLSDKYRGHDGNADDGAGNVLKLNITSNDTLSGSTNAGAGDSAEVSLRINVAPTTITFRQDAEATSTDPDDNNDANNAPIALQADTSATNGEVLYRTAYGTTNLPEISIMENVEHTGREVLAVIDVQDENAVRHGFGTHEVTVSGDDRFVIRKTGGDDDVRDPDSDGSTWELHVVRGATFDYEADDMDGNPSNGVQIVLTFTATDGGGLSTPVPNSPSWLFEGLPAIALHRPIQLIVTIEDDARDNRPIPRGPETPGLKDDADDDDNNDQTDGGDDDTDGGGGTPPPGMSLGGIIEDFIDNMDQGDQDLLEDFLLTIDDGLDIL